MIQRACALNWGAVQSLSPAWTTEAHNGCVHARQGLRAEWQYHCLRNACPYIIIDSNDRDRDKQKSARSTNENI